MFHRTQREQFLLHLPPPKKHTATGLHCFSNLISKEITYHALITITSSRDQFFINFLKLLSPITRQPL